MVIKPTFIRAIPRFPAGQAGYPPSLSTAEDTSCQALSPGRNPGIEHIDRTGDVQQRFFRFEIERLVVSGAVIPIGQKNRLADTLQQEMGMLLQSFDLEQVGQSSLVQSFTHLGNRSFMRLPDLEWRPGNQPGDSSIQELGQVIARVLLTALIAQDGVQDE
jgi:hypothetical protein